jgi:hypothetical protein
MATQRQGIAYQLRRIQIIDAVILAAILGTFTMSASTDRKVTQLDAKFEAKQEMEDRQEARDPVIRESRHKLEIGAIRAQHDLTEARVGTLERAKK